MKDDTHWMQNFYLALTLLNVDPRRIEVNVSHYDDDGDEDGYIICGIPDNKIGFSVEGDQPGPFMEDGWFIQSLLIGDLQRFDSILNTLSAASFEDKRRTLSNTTKQTSRHEDWLLDAMLTMGIPTPDRNLRLNRENGKELTTPDFAWQKYKVAFFVDGLWWHIAKDDTATVNMLRDSENSQKLIEGNKTRAEKDSSIRSQMQLDGWMVLSCTDRELEEPDGPRKQAMNVKKAIDMRKKEQDIISSMTAQVESASETEPEPPADPPETAEGRDGRSTMESVEKLDDEPREAQKDDTDSEEYSLDDLL